MPRYDVRCRACGDTFEVTRSITDLDRAMPCPAGHDDTVRLLSTVAVTRAGSGGAASSRPDAGPAAGATGGGCCGGGCCG